MDMFAPPNSDIRSHQLTVTHPSSSNNRPQSTNKPNYRQPGTCTPTAQYRGSFPTHGGKGRGARGNNRGKKDNSHKDMILHIYQSQRTLDQTLNRFSPLREERGAYHSQYAYMDRDEYQHSDRSPYNYNQDYPGPSYAGGGSQGTGGMQQKLRTKHGSRGGQRAKKRKCM